MKRIITSFALVLTAAVASAQQGNEILRSEWTCWGYAYCEESGDESDEFEGRGPTEAAAKAAVQSQVDAYSCPLLGEPPNTYTENPVAVHTGCEGPETFRSGLRSDPCVWRVRIIYTFCDGVRAGVERRAKTYCEANSQAWRAICALACEHGGLQAGTQSKKVTPPPAGCDNHPCCQPVQPACCKPKPTCRSSRPSLFGSLLRRR